MITKLVLRGSGEEWWAEVHTDSGGDQTYGPYRDQGTALAALRSNVVEAFDEEWKPELLRLVLTSPSSDWTYSTQAWRRAAPPKDPKEVVRRAVPHIG
jgi:hypothetical protein